VQAESNGLPGGVGKASLPNLGAAGRLDPHATLRRELALVSSSWIPANALFFGLTNALGAVLDPLAPLLPPAEAFSGSSLALPRTDFRELGAAETEGGLDREDEGRDLFVGASGSGEGADLFLPLI